MLVVWRRGALRPALALPADAAADADRRFGTGYRRTDRHARSIGVERTLVAHRERALTVVIAGTEAHAVVTGKARRVGRHLRHRRAHRTHTIQTLIDLAELVVHLGLQVGDGLLIANDRVGIGI